MELDHTRQRENCVIAAETEGFKCGGRAVRGVQQPGRAALQLPANLSSAARPNRATTALSGRSKTFH